jgi:signal transduction histidine kinase
VRIAQEALTNAMRHSAARRAIVSLRCEDGAVVVDIDDDGTSGPPDRRREGTGLVGMQERAAACGGRLSIGTSSLGGWQIRAWLPARMAWS